MDKAVAAVRAVNLGKFKAESWQQVALDLDKHADELDAELGDDIDARPLSEILKLVLQPPTPGISDDDGPLSTRERGSWLDGDESPPSTPENSDDEEDAEDEIPNVSVGPSLYAYV